jgi:poly(3-hydroxybutyrate) depolymerase
MTLTPLSIAAPAAGLPTAKFLAAALLAAALLAAASPALAAPPTCPDGYEVKAGLNVDFPHKGEKRAFVVIPPAPSSKPLPVWVPLTGTVESTNANLQVPRSGANAKLAQAGFMVVGPVRLCSEQDPDASGQACNGPGKDGWNWMPWREGRAGGPPGEKWKQDEGPDSSFYVAMLQCVGTRWKLDDRRFYIGGISSGGTMANRALLFRSDFWAGGMPISGEWYVSAEDGSFLDFNAARKAVSAAPTRIHQGRVGPFPLPKSLGPMVVITVWGGERDLWNCGSVLCADYRPSTQAGANYFSAQENGVHVACSASHGHMWPQVNTDAFNRWALETLASHPKGSRPADFRLTSPPEGYQCRVGSFTDHYPQTPPPSP